MGAWRNFTEIQQSGHAPRSGPEVKNGRSSAKDDTPERLRCGTIHKEASQILTFRGCPQALQEELFSFRFILHGSAKVRGQEKAATMAAKSGQFTADKMRKGQFL